MSKDFSSFEAVDAHIQSIETAAYAEKGRIGGAEVSADSLSTVCEAYAGIRPVLVFILRFVPPRWRTVLQGFMTVMDRLCP